MPLMRSLIGCCYRLPLLPMGDSNLGWKKIERVNSLFDRFCKVLVKRACLLRRAPICGRGRSALFGSTCYATTGHSGMVPPARALLEKRKRESTSLSVLWLSRAAFDDGAIARTSVVAKLRSFKFPKRGTFIGQFENSQHPDNRSHYPAWPIGRPFTAARR